MGKEEKLLLTGMMFAYLGSKRVPKDIIHYANRLLMHDDVTVQEVDKNFEKLIALMRHYCENFSITAMLTRTLVFKKESNETK